MTEIWGKFDVLIAHASDSHPSWCQCDPSTWKVPSYLWGPVCPPLHLLWVLEDWEGPDSHCDWLASGSSYGTCSRASSLCFSLWDTFLGSFWTPHQQLACFLWPWPGWAHSWCAVPGCSPLVCRDETLLLICLWPYYMACGTLVSWLRTEPTFPALEGRVITTGPPGKSWIFLLHQLLPCSPELGTLLTIKFFSRSTLPQNGWWRKFRLFGLIFKAIYHLFTQVGFMDKHSHWVRYSEGPSAGLKALLLLSGNSYNFHIIPYISLLALYWLGRIMHVSTPKINFWKPLDLKITHHDLVNEEF